MWQDWDINSRPASTQLSTNEHEQLQQTCLSLPLLTVSGALSTLPVKTYPRPPCASQPCPSSASQPTRQLRLTYLNLCLCAHIQHGLDQAKNHLEDGGRVDDERFAQRLWVVVLQSCNQGSKENTQIQGTKFRSKKLFSFDGLVNFLFLILLGW